MLVPRVKMHGLDLGYDVKRWRYMKVARAQRVGIAFVATLMNIILGAAYSSRTARLVAEASTLA